MTDDFWKLCAESGCVVVAVRAYSQYRDGNLHDDDFIGIRFAALRGHTDCVAPDNWFMVDDGHTGALYETPEAALEAFLSA